MSGAPVGWDVVGAQPAGQGRPVGAGRVVPECRRCLLCRLGTLVENSNVPAMVWLWAVWLMAKTKNGVLSLSPERSHGVSHTTSWYLLDKLRTAMDQTGRDRPNGTVEMGESFGGGYEEGNTGRSKAARSSCSSSAGACTVTTRCPRFTSCPRLRATTFRSSIGSPHCSNGGCSAHIRA